MLIGGGATTLPSSHARVLEALSQAGVFFVGGVVVGSHAFALMANMLGVRWPNAFMRTQDIDIAGDTILVTVPESDIDLEETLKKTGKAFFAVPSLNREHPSTSFKIRGKDISVSLLTPRRGKPDGTPRRIPALNAMAEPLRFLDYLLADIQPVAIPVRHGVLAKVPSPARFALHKLVVAQRRPVAFAEKARKDVAQASAILEVLLEDRPGDITIAKEAAQQTMPKQFGSQLARGIASLPSEIRDALRTLGQ